MTLDAQVELMALPRSVDQAQGDLLHPPGGLDREGQRPEGDRGKVGSCLHVIAAAGEVSVQAQYGAVLRLDGGIRSKTPLRARELAPIVKPPVGRRIRGIDQRGRPGDGGLSGKQEAGQNERERGAAAAWCCVVHAWNLH